MHTSTVKGINARLEPYPIQTMRSPPSPGASLQTRGKIAAMTMKSHSHARAHKPASMHSLIPGLAIGFPPEFQALLLSPEATAGVGRSDATRAHSTYRTLITPVPPPRECERVKAWHTQTLVDADPWGAWPSHSIDGAGHA